MHICLGRFILLISILFHICGRLSAQSPMQLEITGNFHHQSVIQILYTLEREYPVRFYYYPEQMPTYPLSFEFNRMPLLLVLDKLMAGTNLDCINYDSERVIILPRTRREKAYAEELIRQWESGQISLPVSEEPQYVQKTIGDSTAARQATTLILEGRITESRSGQPAIGATIGSPGTAIGAVCNEQGYYRLELPPGNHQLTAQYIGFQTINVNLNIFRSDTLDLEMAFQPLSLNMVIVEARADDRNVASTQAGLEQLSAATVRELPSFLGEADVVKSLTLLPGVSTVGEGAAGFNVRGGNIDQNLILLDGAPIYNSAHALGFFSIFNADAVDEINLYKGNIPAQFGGRASSVLDISIREGDQNQWHGRGGIGMVSSRLLLEGPIQKERSSFLLGGRASYSDWILRSVRNPDVNSSSAYFYDLTGKLAFELSEKTRIEATGYYSFDFFRYADQFGYDWKNLQLGSAWRQLFNDDWSSSLSINFGQYDTRQFVPEGSDAFNFFAGIRYLKGKQHMVFSPNEQHLFNAGMEWLFQDIKPERIEARHSESAVEPRQVEKDQGHELAFYLSDEWELSEALSLSVGLRYSIFLQMGPRTVFTYEEDALREPGNIIDTIRYQSGSLIQRYGGLEPRLSLRYRLSTQNSLKVSYNRLRQYNQLISNTTVPTPADIWQLSTPHLPPLVSDNLSAGFFQNLADNTWAFSVEGYFRWLDDLIAYQDLAELFLNEHLETELLSGQGRAYGVELSLRKNHGKWTGWLAYTYSRSWIRTPSQFPEETINGGNWFPAPFDQPHQFSLVSRWQFNPKSSLTANFVYNSGRPVIAPVGGYFLGETYVPHYSGRSEFRIPDYHRLDLAYTYDNSQGRSKGFRGSLTFGIYNVYFRENTFSIFFRRDDNAIPKAFQLAVLGTAFPYVTYNFVF